MALVIDNEKVTAFGDYVLNEDASGNVSSVDLFFNLGCKIRTIWLLTKDFKYFCSMNNLLQEDTICALATGGGLSAIAILRLSGKEAVKITNAVFSKDILASKSHTIHFGTISDSTKIIDEVLVSIFKDGKSLFYWACTAFVTRFN